MTRSNMYNFRYAEILYNWSIQNFFGFSSKNSRKSDFHWPNLKSADKWTNEHNPS